MAPQEFVEALQQNNQLPALVGEVARNKALAVALGKVNVVDTNGKPVDLTGFVAVDDDEPTAEEEVVEEAAGDRGCRGRGRRDHRGRRGRAGREEARREAQGAAKKAADAE